MLNTVGLIPEETILLSPHYNILNPCTFVTDAGFDAHFTVHTPTTASVIAVRLH